jgi:hypothetical protein
MALITSRCVKIFLDVFDGMFLIGFLGFTGLMIIYNKIVHSMIIYIVYGILMICFCFRNEVHNNQFVLRLEERENAHRNNPVVIENNPVLVVEQV